MTEEMKKKDVMKFEKLEDNLRESRQENQKLKVQEEERKKFHKHQQSQFQELCVHFKQLKAENTKLKH